MSDDLFSEVETSPSLAFDNEGESERTDKKPAASRDTRRISGPSWLMWLIVAGVTSLIAAEAFYSNWRQSHEEISLVELSELDIAAKTLIALKYSSKIPNEVSSSRESVDSGMDTLISWRLQGPVQARLGATILVNEVHGPERALAVLREIRNEAAAQHVRYSALDQDLERILEVLYEAYSMGDWSPDVAAHDRRLLDSRLRWTGRLVLAPPDADDPKTVAERAELVKQARSSLTIVFVLRTVGACTLIAGLVVLTGFVWFLARGRLRGRVARDSRHGAVYIESFALGLLLFLATSFLSGMLSALQWNVPGAGSLMMVLPLTAIAWPLLRGVRAADLREDIGLTTGNVFVEIGAGLVAWLAIVPLLAVMAVISILLHEAFWLVSAPNDFAPTGVPHPIVHELVKGEPFWTSIRIFFLAVVVAPLFEETLFRGVLYRHLRDASRGTSQWISIGFASVVNSMVFAALHPQGLAGLPPLIFLGVAFSLVREWRGSLVAPITMHAVNNGIVSLLLVQQLL